MKTMIGLALFLFGIALLVMVGMLSIARREAATDVAWIWFRGDGDLYRVRPDGKQLQHTLTTPSRIIWSPDGRWLYYQNDGYLRRYSITGRQDEVVTEYGDGEFFMAWSPDGTWFVMSRIIYEGFANVYRLEADGDNQQLLASSEDFHRLTSISPDGEWIYYERVQGTRTYFYRMRSDGSHIEELATSLYSPRIVDWIEGGEGFILEAKLRAGVRHFFWVNARNGTVEQLTDEYFDRQFITWSTDREWLYYIGDPPDEGPDLYRMRVDDFVEEKLTDNDGYLTYVVLSPDGGSIYYELYSDQKTTLNRLNLNNLTTEDIPLPKDTNHAYSLEWFSERDCLTYTEADIYSHRNTYVQCFDTGTVYRYAISDLDTYLAFIDPDKGWGIIYGYDVATDYGALYRFELGSSELQQITPQFDGIFVVGTTAADDRAWSATLLAIIGLAAIGGSLCVGYWLSRS